MTNHTPRLLPPPPPTYSPRPPTGRGVPHQVLGHLQSSLFPPGSSLVAKAHLRMAHGVYYWDEVVHALKGPGVWECVGGRRRSAPERSTSDVPVSHILRLQNVCVMAH